MAIPLRAGVHSVVATPFLPDESLDLASIDTLVDACARAGCDGLLVLGVLGEADRLSDAERDRVVDRFLAQAGDELHITVGVTHPSTVVARERALAAARVGATAVMVSPPAGSVAGPALREHFRRVADGLDCTFVVQDHPASSGVKLPVDFLASLAADLPPGSVVKLEDPPTAAKIAAVRQATDAYQTFGGLGGVSLLYELQAGSAGTMTGFALPELLVGIVRSFLDNDRAKARARFNAALPLITFEAQPGAGVGLRKEILRRRGAIRFATVREPAPPPSQVLLNELDRIMAQF